MCFPLSFVLPSPRNTNNKAIWATIKDTICRGAYGDLFNYTKITNGASHMWFSTLSKPLESLIPSC